MIAKWAKRRSKSVYPPNFAISSQRIACRCEAMISACHTSPTAITLMATTQIAMTTVFCDSEVGTRRQRSSQAIVRGLLVLGRYAGGPGESCRRTRFRVAQEPWQLKGQVAVVSTRETLPSRINSLRVRLIRWALGISAHNVQNVQSTDTFFPFAFTTCCLPPQ